METKAYCSSKPTKHYRSRSGTAHTRLRSLSCPSCGWHRLIDTGNRTVSRTYSSGDPGWNTCRSTTAISRSSSLSALPLGANEVIGLLFS